MSAVDNIDSAQEMLVLVEGVLRETLDLEDRVRKALQCLSFARAELDCAKADPGRIEDRPETPPPPPPKPTSPGKRLPFVKGEK